MSDDPKLLTQDDLQVLLTSFKQEMQTSLQTQREELLKEFDIRENKIHSSYQKKLKNVSPDETEHKPKDARVAELEDLVRQSTQSASEFMKQINQRDQMLAESKQRETILSHKNTFTDTLVKAGFEPKTIDAIYKLQQFDKNFVEDGQGGFNWKVKANGVDVALPLEQAVKHFVKSDLAETFLPPKTAGGGTKAPSETLRTPNPDGHRRLAKVEVDWGSVNKDMHGGSGDGTTAPPFSSR
jgi:hypothetical protein